MDKIDKFYCILDNIKAQYKSQKIEIVMENLNAKVGTERAGEIFGKFGLGIHDEGGVLWVQWCGNNDQPTSAFKESNYVGRETKNQIDYITINKIFRKVVLHCKTDLSANFGSN